MPEFVKPCWELIVDSAKGLTGADFLAPALVDSAAAFSLIGLILAIGLLCTLGKSQGMRWATLIALLLAAGAGYGGYHFTNELVSARVVSAAHEDYAALAGRQVKILRWYWIAPLACVVVLLITLASSKKLSGVALLFAIVGTALTAGGTVITASTQHRVLADTQWDALPMLVTPAESDDEDTDSDRDEGEPADDRDPDDGDPEDGDDGGTDFFGIPIG